MPCCRTVVIYDAPTTLRGRCVTPPLPVWPSKDPANTRTFAADFRNVICGMAIRSAAARATPPVLPAHCTVVGSVVEVVLSGGADCQTARVEITVTLEDGETDTRAILLPIIAQGTLEGDIMATSPTTTLDATAAIIATIPIIGLPGAAVNVQGPVLARNVATGDACSFNVAVVVKNVGTPNAAIDQQSITAFSPPASMSGCSLTIGVAGNFITLWATGLVGAEILWTPNLQTTVA